METELLGIYRFEGYLGIVGLRHTVTAGCSRVCETATEQKRNWRHRCNLGYNSADGAWYKNQPKVGVASSDKGVKVNADGTIDIFFGPKAPAGQQANSIPTTPNTNYLLYFRFYGPKPAVFTKTWQLPDLEEVKCPTTRISKKK